MGSLNPLRLVCQRCLGVVRTKHTSWKLVDVVVLVVMASVMASGSPSRRIMISARNRSSPPAFPTGRTIAIEMHHQQLCRHQHRLGHRPIPAPYAHALPADVTCWSPLSEAKRPVSSLQVNVLSRQMRGQSGTQRLCCRCSISLAQELSHQLRLAATVEGVQYHLRAAWRGIRPRGAR